MCICITNAGQSRAVPERHVRVYRYAVAPRSEFPSQTLRARHGKFNRLFAVVFDNISAVHTTLWVYEKLEIRSQYSPLLLLHVPYSGFRRRLETISSPSP